MKLSKVSWRSFNFVWRLFRKHRDELIVEIEPILDEAAKLALQELVEAVVENFINGKK